MASESQRRIQDGLRNMLNEVDRVHLRSLERDMHLCASKCCESQTATIDDVQDCVRECQTPAIKAGKFVQDEVERFHGFLSRCILQCQDDIKDKMAMSKSNDVSNNRFNEDFDRCASACCEQALERLTPLQKRIIEGLKSTKY